MKWERCRQIVQLLALVALLDGRSNLHAQDPARPRSTTPLQGPVELQIQLALPNPDQLFRPESEATSRARVQEQALRQHAQVAYPPDAPADARQASAAVHCMPPQFATVLGEPFCHHPLYFEDRNTERFGWRVPLAQPLLSTGRFYLDTLLLPCNVLVQPPWTFECHATSPKPGDWVPYQFYLFTWRQARIAPDAAGCDAPAIRR